MPPVGRVHHSYIGTEHLLLGLLAQEDSVAGDVFRRLGIAALILFEFGMTLDRLRTEIIAVRGGEAVTEPPDLPDAPPAGT